MKRRNCVMAPTFTMDIVTLYTRISCRSLAGETRDTPCIARVSGLLIYIDFVHVIVVIVDSLPYQVPLGFRWSKKLVRKLLTNRSKRESVDR